MVRLGAKICALPQLAGRGQRIVAAGNFGRGPALADNRQFTPNGDPRTTHSLAHTVRAAAPNLTGATRAKTNPTPMSGLTDILSIGTSAAFQPFLQARQAIASLLQYTLLRTP